jgi:predicted alpha/beta hydrolase family esterase
MQLDLAIDTRQAMNNGNLNMLKILILPGLTNSGPKHWQTLWEKIFPDLQRVNQVDWENPVCKDWIEELEKAVCQSGDDVVLVAHSLACVLVGKWAEKYPRQIRGALLVAPSDTEKPNYPREAIGFDPMSTKKLPFPCIVVVSTNDPYISVERAQYFSKIWGGELILAKDIGHINSYSNVGIWKDGLKLMTKITGEDRFINVTEIKKK